MAGYDLTGRHQILICTQSGAAVGCETQPQPHGRFLSSPSEDAFLAQLTQAASFMQVVRQAQAESAKNLGGKHHLQPEQLQEITKAASASEFIHAVKEAANVDLPLNRLFERFEEMSRRNRYTVDTELRPAVQKLLAAELWVNHQTLGGKLEALVPATVYHGAFAPSLAAEFPEFARTPYVFGEAARGVPARLHSFLEEARDKVAALASDPEFKHFEKTPSVFVAAAFEHRHDPKDFLRVAKSGDNGWRKMLAPSNENGGTPARR